MCGGLKGTSGPPLHPDHLGIMCAQAKDIHQPLSNSTLNPGMFGGYPGQQPIRPQRAPSDPHPGDGQLQQYGGAANAEQLQPYDDVRARHRDPFSMMDEMMMAPFGGLGRPRARTTGGLGLFDDMFGSMGRMMEEMESMHMGRGGSMMSSSMFEGGGGSMMMSGMSAGGGGSFSSQTFSFSSTMGSDGRMHTEQFSSSSVGDRHRNMYETQQAYSNSSTGVDKMSLERQMDGRGRKVVKERNRESAEERQTDMYKGMNEDQWGEFEQQWNQRAAPALPPHQSVGGGRMMLGDHGAAGRQPDR
eukprot:TRINITY_DN7105_c0_g1_i1.p1 TRINITY_DN7105_c0_g1~~TRINITY_DN7105_c0_g1_i1.p1  ORF type:complete len:302 (-),score=57.50 TRINITY_DN7105_c0_g1_i1:211-1116(-)